MRYLPRSIGVEVESYSSLMLALQRKLSIFPSGNRESSRIHECQTEPINTCNPIDVVLLGEVVRRCMPNYCAGAYDSASTSAHVHTVNYPVKLDDDDISIIMFGLMPFLSISWNRNNFDKYCFRASITHPSDGNAYARFVIPGVAGEMSYLSYDGRYTWVRNMDSRYSCPSIEIRSNENSPLWVYFITAMLENNELRPKLRLLKESEEFINIALTVKNKRGSLDIFDGLIKTIKDFMIPILVNEVPNIVSTFNEEDREFMSEVLTAYLLEDELKYDSLVQEIIDADEGIAEFFNIINIEYTKCKNEFKVIKEKE